MILHSMFSYISTSVELLTVISTLFLYSYFLVCVHLSTVLFKLCSNSLLPPRWPKYNSGEWGQGGNLARKTMLHTLSSEIKVLSLSYFKNKALPSFLSFTFVLPLSFPSTSFKTALSQIVSFPAVTSLLPPFFLLSHMDSPFVKYYEIGLFLKQQRAYQSWGRGEDE